MESYRAENSRRECHCEVLSFHFKLRYKLSYVFQEFSTESIRMMRCSIQVQHDSTQKYFAELRCVGYISLVQPFKSKGAPFGIIIVSVQCQNHRIQH